MTAEILFASLHIATPELILAVGALALLMIGVFSGDKSTTTVTGLAVALCSSSVSGSSLPRIGVAFGGVYIADAFGNFMKVLALIGSITAMILAVGQGRFEPIGRFEYPVLLVLATLGILLMISANNLISLYMALELQSLALYVVCAINRESLRSTEAGLKYFVLGALSSGMLLYGMSLVYGFTGNTGFTEIAQVLASETRSSASFSVWFSCWPVLRSRFPPFRSTCGRRTFMKALRPRSRPSSRPREDRRHGDPRSHCHRSVPARLRRLAADRRLHLHRVHAAWFVCRNRPEEHQAPDGLFLHRSYGLCVVGLAAGTQAGVAGVILYMAVYMVMTLGTFACILAMRRKEIGNVENVEDLAGLSSSNPFMAVVLTILMFSLAGIPPLAGFFGKYYVFLAAIEAKLYPLAIIGVIGSVVGAYYYIRVVKVMWFDEAKDKFERPSGELKVVYALSALFTVAFIVFGGALGNAVTAAAKTFF